MVEQSEIKLLIVHVTREKKIEIQRNFNINTKLVALFEIRVRSLLFDVKERSQYSEVTAIH